MVGCNFVLYCTVLCCAVLYRSFSHDVTVTILVYQNNETAAMLVSRENPVGIENFFHVNHVSENDRLYCIVSYCIVLYCIVLYCIVLYCIALYCILLYRILLYCLARELLR